AHGRTFHALRDSSPANTFAWTPMQEGTYDIQVTVKDGYQASETTSAVVADAVASRVSGSEAVVTPTLNPLVALYSVPPSSAATGFVQFAVARDPPACAITRPGGTPTCGPSCRGRAQTFSSRGCCRTPPTRCGTCSATVPASIPCCSPPGRSLRPKTSRPSPCRSRPVPVATSIKTCSSR